MGAIHQLSRRQLATIGDGLHADGGCLYFHRKGTAASWVFRFKSRHDRRMHWLGLGKYPEVDIDAARRQAAEYRTKIVAGHDVYAEHMQQRRDSVAAVAMAAVDAPAPAYTFKRAALECIADKESGWGEDNRKQWIESLTNYAFPIIGSVAVDRVDTKHILSVLKPIWKDKHETARRLRMRIENILDWAKANKYRSGDNPARWKENLKHVLANGLKKVKRQPAAPIKTIPNLVATLRALPHATARALELLILTATRTGDIRGARFSEFDLEAKIWTIPAMRHKTGKKSGEDHVVPLSDRAVEIVAAQRAAVEDPDGFVFPGTKRARGGMMGNNQMLKLLHAIDSSGAVSHGMRSTFSDWCGEAGHPSDLAELSLAHNVGNQVRRAYFRTKLVEQRRAIMTAWAAYCGG
jgi:integrase